MKNLDGFGDLPSAPGAAAELAQDPPGFELGVRALARGAQPGMGGIGGFLGGRLAAAPVRHERGRRPTGPRRPGGR
jgi:hypothetical protein